MPPSIAPVPKSEVPRYGLIHVGGDWDDEIQSDLVVTGLPLRAELEQARTQLARALTRRDLTADTLRLTEKSYALGESDLPSLLRARASAWESETAVQRQRVAEAASVSRLNQSMGVMP